MSSDASAAVATWSIYVVSFGTAEWGCGRTSNALSAVGRSLTGIHLVVKVRAMMPIEGSVVGMLVGTYVMVSRLGPICIEPYECVDTWADGFGRTRSDVGVAVW